MRAKVLASGKRYFRKGKGFSRGELTKANITRAVLAAKGLRFDGRRKTVHDDNCEALRQ
jgi:ribosomal protein L13E